MLKKSLKIGSILLLIFAMVAFIGCDSGSGDTDPEETPVGPGPGPGPDDPDVPPPPVEVVTGVTITPESLEMLAGERYLFKAEVSGTVADKTVKWSVAIADEDPYNVKEDGTTITDNKGAGLLVIDGGQYWGTILTITAVSNADPSQFAEATVKVVKPGPRLSWTPPTIAVTTGDEGAIDEDAISVGRLLDIYGKDITIFDGEYIEGQHYYIRRVDNLNNSVQGGTVTVTGSADEGTITVTLNGNVIGDKGPIGITLYQSVLEGADATAIDLEASELVFNVTSGYLITGLSALPDYAEPLRGSVPTGPVVGNATYGGIDVTEIKWTGLTSNTYTHRTPAVATITLTAKSNYNFYTLGIKESTIKAKFKNGSPEVAIITNSSKTLKFTLTYTITAKTIKKAAGTDAVAANFGSVLNDLILSQGVVNHNQEAPTQLQVKGESLYYSLNKQPVEWEGLAGKNFSGGKLAVATITIPAKPGYTFADTDLTAADLAGPTAIFKTGGDIDHDGTLDADEAPAAEIISQGDTLVFTLSYYVPKTWITRTDIGAYVTGKLPSAVVNATPVTNLSVHKNAPFTGGSGTVIWTGLNNSNKFAYGFSPKATVTLLAKDGYEFSNETTSLDMNPPRGFSANGTNQVAVSAISTDASVTGTTTVFNLGNKLVFTVDYSTAVRRLVDTLTLGTWNTPIGTVVHNGTKSTPVALAGSQIDGIGGSNLSTFTWGSGIFNNKYDYTRNNGNVIATAVLKPAAGYTFSGFSTSNQDNKDYIAVLFTTSDAVVPAVSLSTTTGSNDLTVVLTYPIAKALLPAGTVLPNSYNPNFGTIIAFGNVPTGSIPSLGAVNASISGSWTGGVTSGKFNATGTATYTAFITPVPGYTVGALGPWETAVTAVTNFPSSKVAALDGDTVKITLTYPITPITVSATFNGALIGSLATGVSDTWFKTGESASVAGSTYSTVASLWSIGGIGTTAGVNTTTGVAWTIANPTGNFATNDKVIITIEITPVPGYKLPDVSTNSIKTNLEAAITINGVTDEVTVTSDPSATTPNKVTVKIELKL